MARWRRLRPFVLLPDWVLDPATDDGEAWAWAEAMYLDGNPDVWFEVFQALISVPRYGGYDVG
jgi:hypothetical protein